MECYRCNTTKPIDEFRTYVQRGKTYPIHECFDCRRARARTWNEANRGKRRITQKNHRLRYIEQYRAKAKEAYASGTRRIDPHYAEHYAVNKAIRQGVLVRPEACEDCGTVPKRTVHAHHPDYSKPLDVRWLCDSCHGIAHHRIFTSTDTGSIIKTVAGEQKR